MATMELALEDVVLRVDEDALEMYRPDMQGGYKRLLLRWLLVRTEAVRHDTVLLNLWAKTSPGPVLYGPLQKGEVPTYKEMLTTTVQNEQQFRAFFTQVAGLTGRTVAP